MNPEFLREAIRLSLENVENNQGGPFGAVIACNGEIIARGWNRVTSTNDPTAHAELVAIRNACFQLQTFSLQDCEIYCSCEPCPMCLAGIYWARLACVHYAASSEDAAIAGFDDQNFYHEFSKPADQRRIPVQQALRGEAAKAFQAWIHKVDRIQY